MTYNEFINKEIATWGEDYIFSLLDRGYEATMLSTGNGDTRWSWVMPRTNLTPANSYAKLSRGRASRDSSSTVSPVSVEHIADFAAME